MRNCRLFFTLISFLCSFAFSLPKYPSVTFDFSWKELELFPQAKKSLEVRWAVIGFILGSAREKVLINKLELSWNGKPLENLSFSLHKEPRNCDSLMLEENFIGNGSWNKEKQKIKFNLNEKILGRSKYYVIVMFKPGQESILKSGNFKVLSNYDKQS